MSVYTYKGLQQSISFSSSGYFLNQAYDIYGPSLLNDKYIGGYIEIQPDSFTPNTNVFVEHVDLDDPTAWGFPASLSPESAERIKNEMFNGINGIKYIRLPMGFAYRGARNYDLETGLARNFGERWSGQNEAMKSWFSEIAKTGGGLAPEYWCFAPHWITSGLLYGLNEVCAGGEYDRSVTLASIRESDPIQYQKQVDEFSDAILDDCIYLNKNIAPVVMFTLWNEPNFVAHTEVYGFVGASDVYVYNDLMTATCKKLKAEFPNIKLFCASSVEDYPFDGIASKFLEKHSSWMWGYSHHRIWDVRDNADSFYKSNEYKKVIGNRTNVFINEYELENPNPNRVNFYCANNMVRLIDEIVYGGATCLLPIIHICKPAGQSITMGMGYPMFSVDMETGDATPNPWVYNSWKMFNENLLIGSKRDSRYTVNVDNVAFVAMIKDGKLRLFMANNGNTSRTFSVDFDESKNFSGKLYDISNVGTQQASKEGETITFTIPAYSGLFYEEVI